MSTTGYRGFCGLSLAVLLLCPLAPAGAWNLSLADGYHGSYLEETSAAEGFGLQLEETFAAEGLGVQMVGQETPSSQFRLTAALDPEKLSQVAAQQEVAEQATPKKGKTGRWLKKHWYVPVLAAIAIGVAVGGSSDNDQGGEEEE
jgi:hypothetical protein